MITLTDAYDLLIKTHRTIVCAAVQAAFEQEGRRGSVDICVLNAQQMREENLRHRGIDSTTDVLSFPAVPDGGMPPDGFYGDVLLNPVRAREQAEAYGHTLERELAFLAVHGMLHLFGYDHMDTEEELRMRQAQARILERMELKR